MYEYSFLNGIADFTATAKSIAFLDSSNIQLSKYAIDFGPGFMEKYTENPEARDRGKKEIRLVKKHFI